MEDRVEMYLIDGARVVTGFDKAVTAKVAGRVKRVRRG